MIEKISINAIKSNPNNPRVIRDDKFRKLVKSINEFPEMLELRPIVVNDKMIVLGGNMRLKACREAGLKDVYVIKASNLSEEQQKEFIIKDNAGFGEWDWDTLANEYDDEELKDWGIDIPKFDSVGHSGEGEGNFDDPGIEDKNQYGVIVICESAGTQESVFNDLTNMGFKCKIVVT